MGWLPKKIVAGMAAWLVLLCLFAELLADAEVALAAQEEGAHLFVTQIAPGLSIVGEVSLLNPYRGEQFSIVYSLRAVRFPTAVDVEPQQYSDFWAEAIPLPEQTRTIIRMVNGRPAYEFLLRQVVAYPLNEGNIQLPPLAVKVKMAGALGADTKEWDLLAESKPIPIQVLRIPPFQGQALPLVGSLHGSLAEVKRTEGVELLLNIEGTANLAFFQPLDWLRGHGGFFLSPRLLSVENQIQTRDQAGRPYLILSQRRQWSIRFFPTGVEPARMDDLTIPVLRPETGERSVLRIAAVSLASPADRAIRRDAARASDQAHGWGLRGYLNPYVALLLVVAVLFGLSRLWRMRGKALSLGDWEDRSLRLLEKQSRAAPRSFLETAHRILLRHAEENHLIPAIGKGDTPFDRCWSEIEKIRFIGVDPPAELRTSILDSIRSLLRKERRVSGSASD